MFIYYFLLLVFISSFLINNLKQNGDISININAAGILLLGCLFCIFLGGFRWYTGTDWDNYSKFFLKNDVFEDFKNNSFEIGWAILNFLVKKITNSYTIYLLFFHSLIILINVKATFLFFKNNSFDISLFSLLYFTSHRGDIFATRQMLACALLFLAYAYYMSNKTKFFYIITFFACTIHVTSFIFFFVPLLTKMKFNKIITYLIIISSIIFLKYASSIFLLIVQKIIKVLPAGRVLNKVISYKNNESSISLIFIIRYLIFIPFLVSFYKKGNNNYRCFFNIYFFGCILFIITSGIMPVLQRFALYFTNFEALLLAIYFKNIKKNIYKYLFLFMIIGYAIFKYSYSFYGEYQHLYIPYYSIFNFQIR